MRSKWLPVVVTAAAVTLGSAACADDEGAAGDRETTTEQQAAAQRATASADTGRMSEGEFSQAQDAIAEIDRELSEYAETLSSRCSLMAGAGEVSETLDCVDEAFDGVEKHIGIGYSTFESLQADVGKACRRNVVRMTKLLNIPLYRAAMNSKDAMSSLDTARMEATTTVFARQRTAFSEAGVNLMIACAPK